MPLTHRYWRASFSITSHELSGLPSFTNMTSYCSTNFGRASFIRRTRGSMNISPRKTGMTMDRFIGTAVFSPASQPNAVPVCQYGQSARHLSRSLLCIPAEYITKHIAQLIQLFTGEMAKHSQHGTPQHKIIEMHDLFMLNKERDLTAGVIWHRPENKVRATIHERGNRLCTRAIALE